MRPSRRKIRHLVRRGQAWVESAFVLPVMIFVILGLIQLAMVQHAKIMTEYAAFCAARAGIVWNADRWMMENAAIIALLPTYEGLLDDHDLGNPLQMLKRIAQRALLYQVNRRLPQAVDMVRNGTDRIIQQLPDLFQGPAGNIRDRVLQVAEQWADRSLRDAITDALGPDGLQMVTVDIVSPTLRDLPLRKPEVDFDDVRRGRSWRKATRLSIRVTYLYMMRIPFANSLIHMAWRAQRLGARLYGNVFRPSTNRQDDSLTRFATTSPALVGGDRLTRAVARLANETKVYLIPLTATYTMRMQSNPYRVSISESH